MPSAASPAQREAKRLASSGLDDSGHFVVSLPVEFAAREVLTGAAPLLEEEWNPSRAALPQ